MKTETDANGIVKRAAVPDFPRLFVIGHRAPQVTVYSQQVRALKLIWALDQQQSLAGEQIVVVGGGIAGVTTTAAALLHGANVTLLEKSEELLHLQRGCHTRYLHPRIFEWPHPDARRAGAELPILTWSVGTASEVATRILAGYHRIRLRLEEKDGGGRKFLNEITSVCEVRLSDDGESISWRGQKCDCIKRPRAIVLTLGFGIETTVRQLPRRSYWRVDSLTQTALDSEDDEYVVLVGGTGDGGIIDVLRAKLKEFDHGGFLDECVLRLGGEALRGTVDEIEVGAAALNQWLQSKGHDRDAIAHRISEWLHTRYSCVPEIAAVDELLDVIRPQTRVIWTGRPPYPVSLDSQPLNRVLGWRLWRRGHVEYKQGGLKAVQLLDQERASGYRYEIILASSKAERSVETCINAHQVVVRYGCNSALARSFPLVYEALKNSPAAERERGLPQDIQTSYKDLVSPTPASWRSDVMIRATPEYGRCHDDGKRYYRIKIWLDSSWALGHVSWVDYDLHPEYGTVHRRAMWMRSPRDNQQFRHWINTRDDFWIRVRCSDGLELGAWLSDAIEHTDVKNDSELVERCKSDLRKEAEDMRGKSYRSRPWCDYVDLP